MFTQFKQRGAELSVLLSTHGHFGGVHVADPKVGLDAPVVALAHVPNDGDTKLVVGDVDGLLVVPRTSVGSHHPTCCHPSQSGGAAHHQSAWHAYWNPAACRLSYMDVPLQEHSHSQRDSEAQCPLLTSTVPDTSWLSILHTIHSFTMKERAAWIMTLDRKLVTICTPQEHPHTPEHTRTQDVGMACTEWKERLIPGPPAPVWKLKLVQIPCTGGTAEYALYSTVLYCTVRRLTSLAARVSSTVPRPPAVIHFCVENPRSSMNRNTAATHTRVYTVLPTNWIPTWSTETTTRGATTCLAHELDFNLETSNH